MRLRSLHVVNQPQLMIIPMIDIIFFLLVFFMMSTLYMVEQHTIPVNLPQATAVQQETRKNINITIKSDGKVLFNQEEMLSTMLNRRVAMELVKQPEQGFIVRADKQVEYGTVISVLDQIKQAGAHKVALATELKAR